MNRIEVVAVFKAMEVLGESGNLDGMMKVIKTVLNEAQVKPLPSDKTEKVNAE